MYRLLFALALLSFPSAVHAAGTVGNGSAGSCNEKSFNAALVGGGRVELHCGSSGILFIQSQKTIELDTEIVGTGDVSVVVLKTNTRHFLIHPTVRLVLTSLTLKGGRAVSPGSTNFEVRGGAILNTGNLTLNQVTFSDNWANQGGAIFNAAGEVIANDSLFSVNKAARTGGAIATTGGTVTITNSSFSGNTAGTKAGDELAAIFGFVDGEGGAIANGSFDLPGSSLTLIGSTLGLNLSTFRGGAISSSTNEGGNLAISGSTISANQSRFGGGAFHTGPADSTGLNISNTRFVTNLAEKGAGLNVSGGTSLSDTAFDTNVASVDGGGLYASFGKVHVFGCSFAANRAGNLGGGILQSGVTEFRMYNSTVSANRAQTGGGYAQETVRPNYIYYTTFQSNRARRGASISGQEVLVRFSIISSPASSSNCSHPLSVTSRNIQYPGRSCGRFRSADPLLNSLSAVRGTITRVHIPKRNSPVIDFGSAGGDCGELEPFPNNLDQRGARRPLNGDRRGTAMCDTGSFELGR